MTDTEDFMREFVAGFETRDAERVGSFFHEDILFANYAGPEVLGKPALVEVWAHVFSRFQAVRFETLHQSIEGSIVLAEQFHHLAARGRETATIRVMARYTLRDGLIGVWREFTDRKFARPPLDAIPSRPIGAWWSLEAAAPPSARRA